MKRVPLKNVVVKMPDGTETPMSYWIQLFSIMRAPINVQQGADVEEIRKSIRVIDALEKAGKDAEFLDLEDSDFQHLQTKISAAKFGFSDRSIVQFVDDVLAAETI